MNQKMTVQHLHLQLDKTSSRHIDPATGFLHCKIRAAMAQVQRYHVSELPDLSVDSGVEFVNVLRPASEVSSKASLDSMSDKPITMLPSKGHPNGGVTSDNIEQQHVVGYMKNAIYDDKTGSMIVDAVIQKQEAIDKIMAEDCHVSLGYFREIEKNSGTFNGMPYDYAFKKIVGQHLSFVDTPRAGADALVLDKKEGPSMKDKLVKLMAIDSSVTLDQAHAALVEQEIKALTNDAEMYKKKAEDAEASEAKAKKEAEKTKGQLAATEDALKKAQEQLTDDAISARLKEVTEVTAQAQQIVGDSFKTESLTTDGIMREALKAHGSATDVDKMSNDAVQGYFSALLSNAGNHATAHPASAIAKDSMQSQQQQNPWVTARNTETNNFKNRFGGL